MDVILWGREDKPMPHSVVPLFPAAPETEKITINLGHVDLGKIDLLVREGFYTNRSDLIRTAIRAHLDRHQADTATVQTRLSFDMGIRQFGRADLEALRDAGERLDIKVLGLAIIAPDVGPDLARATISRLTVLGTLQASREVKAALADRMG
jgi:Arc/MetJ-type ribon-helix-helix transcriptional regulator